MKRCLSLALNLRSITSTVFCWPTQVTATPGSKGGALSGPIAEGKDCEGCGRSLGACPRAFGLEGYFQLQLPSACPLCAQRLVPKEAAGTLFISGIFYAEAPVTFGNTGNQQASSPRAALGCLVSSHISPAPS